MSRIKTENLQDVLELKKQGYSLRVTSYIKGSVKNNFIDDCIRREYNESKMLGVIVDTYYSVINKYPDIKGKEPNEIKKFIMERITFDTKNRF